MFDLFASTISFFYQITHSFAVSIILLTVLVRLIVFPLTAKQARSMAGMQKLQPKIKELQASHKEDRTKMQEEMMKLYREHKVNPAAGCLPLLVQIPIFIVLYRVIHGLTSSDTLAWLGIRVPRPNYLSQDSEMYRALVNGGGRMLSWGLDLALSPSAALDRSLGTALPYFLLMGLIVVTGFLQQRQAAQRAKGQPSTPQTEQMQRIMKFLPVLFGVFSFNFQAGLLIYFVASNLWTMGQQTLIFRSLDRADRSSKAAKVIDVQESKDGADAGDGTVKGKGANGQRKAMTPPQIAQGPAKGAAPTSGKSGVDKPTSGKPGVAKPGADKPGVGKAKPASTNRPNGLRSTTRPSGKKKGR